MSVVVRYQPTSLTREQYDRVNQILAAHGDDLSQAPLGIHVLFGEDPHLRVSEVWESESEWRHWYDGALGAALAEAGVEGVEPEIMDVQELWGSALNQY